MQDMNMSDHTSSENATKRQLHGFLLPNSTYGQGTTSQACNARLTNGFRSKDENVFAEASPVKASRKMIDLQLPANQYLDADEVTIFSPYKRSKSGRGDDASHRRNSSGSCLDVKSSSGILADLNEPLIRQDSEPVALSKDTFSQRGRHNADVEGQWLEKNTCQNGWMVLDKGQGRSSQRELHLPPRSLEVRFNNADQPQIYPTAEYRNVMYSRERAYREMEVCSVNPQASYDSYVESTVASSNAPRLHNDYRSDFVRPLSHWSSSWENTRNSSHKKSYPVQTNPFMNFVTHSRADSSFETRSHVLSNGTHHGFSSGQSFENLQGPSKKQERSTALPWLKPKPTYKCEVSNGFLDLNASTNQFMDGTDAGDGLDSVCPQKSLRSSGSCSNNVNTVRVQKHTSLLSHSDQHKEVNHLVKRDFDINLPYDDASVSVDQHGAKAFCVKKEEGNKGNNVRHYFDLNSCASEDDDVPGLSVKTEGTFWIDLEAPPTLESEEEDGESSQEKSNEGQDGNSSDELIKVAAQAIVAISLSDHPDDAASSSTDAVSESLLSWFADIIITTCGDELERKIVGSTEEYSSGENDYFEAMTLSLHPTKEEDYMPEPLVPENLILEGTGLNKPRRGKPRRGRPKRDFQRDTLPGLSSLTRQEVTEDIQLFGGLMRSREYSSGVAARQNSKGRKRMVTNISQAPMNENVSVVELEDSNKKTAETKVPSCR